MINKTATVLIAGSTPYNRTVLAETIKTFGYTIITADLSQPEDGLKYLEKTKAHIIIAELEEEEEKLAKLQKISKHYPQTTLIILTSHPNLQLFESKNIFPQNLTIASKKKIQNTEDLHTLIEFSFLKTALANGRKQNLPPNKIKEIKTTTFTAPLAFSLSPTQLGIFRLIPKGYTNKEIADRLHLTEKYVANSIKKLAQNLGLETKNKNIRVLIAVEYHKQTS
jgi:DNA-binding NarL/FixJ family response regulator